MRSLRPLDPSISLEWVKRAIAGYDEHQVIRARNATLRQRPEKVQAFFESQFRRVVPGEAPPPVRAEPVAIKSHGDDPYGL